ncbi:hypothetical protein [Halalkalibacter nanhaiisediminis]|uniref:Uncharacterized protein n=1 Tax=Halalkalibacter nanhaiisediminis TaxID=688079 RepID=A0A562QR02_9BACI|nr:hypothetical protein [Halalkalibacter nanhaiisediminis]TWI59181.1 hypothetical protein IQ10_00894 [Halalkalibacter nanhaiisediminis]
MKKIMTKANETVKNQAMILAKVNVKSKKKRIVKKVLKKAIHQEMIAKVSPVISEETQIKEKEKENVTLSVNNLPVTTLLQLGKKYLKEEEVVKYYYNAEKEAFYKNKTMLVSVLDEKTKELQPDERKAYNQEVEELWSKRKKN